MKKTLKILSALLIVLAIIIIPIACSMQQASGGNDSAKTINQNAEALFAAASTVTLEAETMSKSGYSNESNASASNGVVIRLSSTSGSVTKNFSGVTASYNIAVKYIDQSGGTSTFSLSIGGTAIGSWSGDQATGSDLFLTKTFSNITVANGQQIKLSGTKNGTELAKFDVIVFTPVGAASSSSSVATTSSSSSTTTSSSSSSSSSVTTTSSSSVSTSVSASDLIGWGKGTTGGAGGSTINVTTMAELKTAASQSGAAIIVIQNDILAGTQQINVAGNKTIIGAGSGVKLDFGFTLTGDNVIIRNLDMMNGGFNPGDTEGQDCITCNGRQYVWIDHCTMHEAMDGLIDPCKGSRFVTISYCYFYKQRTALLIGDKDGDSHAASVQSNADKSLWDYTVTIHHCYFSGSLERNPRVRFGAVHIFNNYVENSDYAVGRGVGANIYSENNYFYNTTQVWYPWDTTSKPGYVKDVNSLFEGNNGDITDKPPTGTWVWTPSQYYSYSAHSAQWVKDNLKNYAGAGKSNPQ